MDANITIWGSFWGPGSADELIRIQTLTCILVCEIIVMLLVTYY